ncbi:MAG: isochorismate synthase [Chlorobiaceae bacterium]|nr:isochorismate synthase [Chlorobiaceae bacterium]
MSEHYHIITPTEEPLSIDKAVSSLASALNIYADEHALPDHRDRTMLVTFRQLLQPTDLPEWLYRQSIYPRLFWMNRERDFSVAGIGVADTITFEGSGSNEASFLQFAHDVADKEPDARYFGGFRFNNEEQQEPIWREFSSFSFVLPLVQLTFENGTYSLSCHLWLECSDKLQTKISAITDMLRRVRTDTDTAVMKLPELLNLSYNPDEKSWIEQCQKALRTFESGDMEKIMLARQTTLEFSNSFSPLLFLLQYPYPQNTIYRFYFEPAENQAFFSFTPERLYRRDGKMLLTEALAGTCSKESMNGDDGHASEVLLNSEKDIREHNFVREMIYDELFKICSNINMEKEVQVLQLNRLAHLYTRCTAELKPEFEHDSAVLQLLHPTPAVGGVPKAPAMDQIMELEPFSRGWYAAPVGWVSRDAAEFSVAIRSALVNGRFAYLYSGAGLVTGSDPYSEWEEVDQKIGDILAITRQEA